VVWACEIQTCGDPAESTDARALSGKTCCVLRLLRFFICHINTLLLSYVLSVGCCIFEPLRGAKTVAKKEKIVITGEMIEIKGELARHEIVRKVINIFIDAENQQRGKGVKFRYPVENLSINKQLFIYRPGGLNKWNFDFKVEVTPELGLGKGRHEEIASDLRNKKQENQQKFGGLLQVITEIYNCSENDVDRLLKNYTDLQRAFQTGAKVDVLLKVVKWMFIMEDIVYWNYQGRSMLYNGLKEV
jgi:hypothetical protein